MDFIKIHPDDNVAVALRPMPAGSVFEGITAQSDIPQGHKMALTAIEKDATVTKYGFAIGHATAAVEPGQWVHTHNMTTNLAGELEYPQYGHKPLRTGGVYIQPQADTPRARARPHLPGLSPPQRQGGRAQ